MLSESSVCNLNEFSALGAGRLTRSDFSESWFFWFLIFLRIDFSWASGFSCLNFWARIWGLRFWFSENYPAWYGSIPILSSRRPRRREGWVVCFLGFLLSMICFSFSVILAYHRGILRYYEPSHSSSREQGGFSECQHHVLGAGIYVAVFGSSTEEMCVLFCGALHGLCDVCHPLNVSSPFFFVRR